MFLSNENLDHIKMCIVIDTHNFRKAGMIDCVYEDFAQLKTYVQLEEFYNKYCNIFSYLCSFKISLIISNYKLANTILVLKFISKIKYRVNKRRALLKNSEILV